MHSSEGETATADKYPVELSQTNNSHLEPSGPLSIAKAWAVRASPLTERGQASPRHVPSLDAEKRADAGFSGWHSVQRKIRRSRLGEVHVLGGFHNQPLLPSFDDLNGLTLSQRALTGVELPQFSGDDAVPD